MSFFDRFDLDVILNIAAGVILAGVVLGVLYFIFWCVFMFIAANREKKRPFQPRLLPPKYLRTAPRPASWALA